MNDLEARLTAVAEELEFAGDWNDRYRLLVEWGEEMTPLEPGARLSECEVPGCSSPLWLRVRWAGSLEVQGASTGILPLALVALVVRLFDGLGAPVGPVPPIADRLGLTRNLSPTRLRVFDQLVSRVMAGVPR